LLNRPLVTRGASAESNCGATCTGTSDDAPTAPRFHRGSELTRACDTTSMRRLASRWSQLCAPLRQTGRRELSAAPNTRTAAGTSHPESAPLVGEKVTLAGLAYALGPNPLMVTSTGALGFAERTIVYSAGTTASPKLQ